MKKILLGAMIASVALAASATELASSNVVGYTKLDLSAGYTIVGNQFKNIGSTEQVLDISQVVASGLTGGDQARFWDPTTSTYETIVYYGEENDGGVYSDDSYEECLGPGWGDGDQILAKYTIPSGESFWISGAGASTITFSGEVPTATTKDFVAGYTLVCNPMPKEINLADVKATGLTGGDQARFWDPITSTYETIVYYGEENDGGVYSDDSYEECLGPGWGDGDQIIISKEIKIGEGFWISAASSGTLSF